MRKASMMSRMPPIRQKCLQEQQAMRLPSRQPVRMAKMLNTNAHAEAHSVSKKENPTPKPTAILSKESAMPSDRASKGLRSLSQFLSACLAWLSQEVSDSLISPNANKIAKPAICINSGETTLRSSPPAVSDSISVLPEIAERINKEETGIFTRLMP